VNDLSIFNTFIEKISKTVLDRIPTEYVEKFNKGALNEFRLEVEKFGTDIFREIKKEMDAKPKSQQKVTIKSEHFFREGSLIANLFEDNNDFKN
jgi:hypothetical protein